MLSNEWTSNLNIKIFLLSLVYIIARCIPHTPNISPQIVFILYFASILPLRKSLSISLGLMLISDLLLSILLPTMRFSSWVFFSYSGMLSVLLWRNFYKEIHQLTIVFVATLFFWFWTNLGTWLLSGMYAHTTMGLLSCYTLALPFLTNAMAGSLIWELIVLLLDASISDYHQLLFSIVVNHRISFKTQKNEYKDALQLYHRHVHQILQLNERCGICGVNGCDKKYYIQMV